MTILHVTNDLYPDGAQACLSRLVLAMDRGRFRHVVVALRPGGSLAATLRAAGIEVVSLGVRGRRAGPRPVAAFLAVARSVRADIVDGWTYNSNLFALTAKAAGLGVRLVWNVATVLGGGELGTFQRCVQRAGVWLSRVPDAIVYNSHAGAAAHAAVGYDRRRSRVIHNGVPAAEAAEARQRGQAWRARLGIGASEVVVSYVKRLVQPRWHRFLLDAAALVASRHPGVRFVCVGRGVDTLERDPGDPARVVLLGHTDDVAAVHAGSDIAVSASAREGLPNAVAEAMASGLPCVVTDVGDSAVLVGETGRVVSFGDVAGLARAIGQLVEMGEDGRRRLGAAARARVAEQFSVERMCARYAELYEQLRAA